MRKTDSGDPDFDVATATPRPAPGGLRPWVVVDAKGRVWTRRQRGGCRRARRFKTEEHAHEAIGAAFARRTGRFTERP